MRLLDDLLGRIDRTECVRYVDDADELRLIGKKRRIGLEVQLAGIEHGGRP